MYSKHGLTDLLHGVGTLTFFSTIEWEHPEDAEDETVRRESSQSVLLYSTTATTLLTVEEF